MTKMKCRCGNELEYESAGNREIIVFCNACYTNYVLKIENNEAKIKLVYYFPDD